MPGVDFTTKLLGYSRVIDGLEDLLDEWITEDHWVVGTPAEYAINRIVASV